MASPLTCAASAAAQTPLRHASASTSRPDLLDYSLNSILLGTSILNLCFIYSDAKTHSLQQQSPTMANKKPPTRKEIILAIIALIALFGIILLLTFLATDLFTIPYLTPFAHFLALIISPFVPLIFPIYLSLFLKVCAYKNRNKEWPGKKKWVFITGCWGFSHFERFVRDSWKIWGKVYQSGDVGEVCGLDNCKGYWVEEVLVVLVVLAQVAGWKLDGGMADRWIESLVKREKAAMESAKNADGVESMEKGEFMGEEVAVVDVEKQQLMKRDEIMAAALGKQEVSIEVVTDQVVERAEEIKA